MSISKHWKHTARSCELHPLPTNTSFQRIFQHRKSRRVPFSNFVETVPNQRSGTCTVSTSRSSSFTGTHFLLPRSHLSMSERGGVAKRGGEGGKKHRQKTETEKKRQRLEHCARELISAASLKGLRQRDSKPTPDQSQHDHHNLRAQQLMQSSLI